MINFNGDPDIEDEVQDFISFIPHLQRQSRQLISVLPYLRFSFGQICWEPANVVDNGVSVHLECSVRVFSYCFSFAAFASSLEKMTT